MRTDPESMLAGLKDRERSRHYGKYRGIVKDVSDPDQRCRIKVGVPGVYLEELSPWAEPALPFAGAGHGLVLLPEVGDLVWVEFEAGDIRRPIWTGFVFAQDQRPDPKGEKVRLLATSAGHQIVIDEQGDTIEIKHPGGGKITLSADEITLSIGASEIKIGQNEINLNHGMVKVTAAGASLVNDAFKVGL